MSRARRTWPIAFSSEGLNIARLLRQAGEAKLRLTQVRRTGPCRVEGLIRESDLPALSDLAYRGGWTLTTGGRRGTGQLLEKLRRRWVMACAVVIAGLALLGASRFMWRIEVVDAGAYEADVRAALAEWGISAPMLRSRVDVGQLREALAWRYPRIAWFECGWRGMTLVIHAEEGVIPLEDGDAGQAMDLVATRDGIVHTVITRAGTPQVQPGDIVQAGEVLICGEERTADGGMKAVAAQGSVLARVWEGASVTMSLQEWRTTYTGRTETVWTIRTPWFDLWQLPEADFDHYDTAVSEMAFGGIFMPMKLHIETRREAEYDLTARELEAVKAEAYAAAVRKLHQKVGDAESFIDIWGNCSMIEDGKLLSVAVGELVTDIGRQQPASGMAAPEQPAAE